MQILQLHRGATFGFWLSFLLLVSSCYSKDETVEVVGFVERTDFTQSKIKTSQTFSGFYVSIGCKSADGKLKTMGSSELDEGEKFKIILPREIIKDGVVEEECYAQLHLASDSPCPLHNSQEALKISFQYKARGKQTINQIGKLPITCTSKFLWHFHTFPSLHKWWPPLLGTPFHHQQTRSHSHHLPHNHQSPHQKIHFHRLFHLTNSHFHHLWYTKNRSHQQYLRHFHLHHIRNLSRQHLVHRPQYQRNRPPLLLLLPILLSQNQRHHHLHLLRWVIHQFYHLLRWLISQFHHLLHNTRNHSHQQFLHHLLNPSIYFQQILLLPILLSQYQSHHCLHQLLLPISHLLLQPMLRFRYRISHFHHLLMYQLKGP